MIVPLCGERRSVGFRLRRNDHFTIYRQQTESQQKLIEDAIETRFNCRCGIVRVPLVCASGREAKEKKVQRDDDDDKRHKINELFLQWRRKSVGVK